MPFSEVLRLLNAPTPHVITTTTTTTCNTCNTAGNITTTIGNMFGSSNSSSRISSHPHPHHPGNAAKKLRGTLSAASVGPRTPGSNSKTAPPSTSRSLAPPPPTPPSPAALAPLSPRRVGSIRTPRAFAPLLTDVRRVSWRRKGSGKWGGGNDAKGKANGKETDDRATSAAAFFSSPAATPTNSSSSSSFTRPARLNPWGGGTPGGKPSRLSRTRTMFSSTFTKLSPRAAISSRPAVPAFNARVNGGGNASTAALPTTPSPGSPAAAPPSPAGSSPFDKEKGLDASPADVSAEPSTTPRTSRQELLGLGAAAVANRRGSKLRFPLKLGGDSSDDGEDAEKAGKGEGNQDEADDLKISRQPSRESIMSSSSAFFASDTESEHGDERGQRKGDRSRAKEEEKNETKKKKRGHHSAADKDKGGGLSKLNGGHTEQEEEEGETTEVPLREQEEEEIVALSSYLASARRGWPWMGQDVLWAEYVALNGHHRCVKNFCVDLVLILTPFLSNLLLFWCTFVGDARLCDIP